MASHLLNGKYMLPYLIRSTRLCNPRAGSRGPGFQTQRLKPNGLCCWEIVCNGFQKHWMIVHIYYVKIPLSSMKSGRCKTIELPIATHRIYYFYGHNPLDVHHQTPFTSISVHINLCNIHIDPYDSHSLP